MQSPVAFALGLAAVLALGSVYRLARGLRLHLLLVQGPEGEDQVVIPVTMENRRSFSWRSIREKRWQESVELVLADDDGRYADLSFSFHLWMHFLVTVADRPDAAPVKLNSRPLPLGRKIRLVNGDRLDVGGRKYWVRVTPTATKTAE